MLKRKSTDFRRDYFKLIFYIVMRWVLKIIENEEGDENGEIIYYDELFWALSLNDIDESIIPFIELLKTRDIKKAINALRISKFKVSENIEESFKNFVDYLLQDDRYKDFFKQSMGRYNITEYNREIYKEIFDTTMQELEEKLYTVKNYKNGELYFFDIREIIQSLRWDIFFLKLGNWIKKKKKDYLDWNDAKKINDNHSQIDKPVYGLRMHVWENASIYSLRKVLKKMRKFIETANIWVVPYVSMISWLLDTDFVRHRCIVKKWDIKQIWNFISNNYGILWDIEIIPITDPKIYEITYKNIINHLNEEDKWILDNYLMSWFNLSVWKCLVNLQDI